MIIQKEFNIKSTPDTFRVAKISAIEMLALQSQIDFSDMTQTKTVYTFILEHLEVSILGVWTPVKEKNREIYCPEDLEQDLAALQELVMYFLQFVLKPLFVKSEELSQKQPLASETK